MDIGKFIVFEGGEGSGKTRHMKMTELQLIKLGHTVLTTHEPGGTPLGQQLRHIILTTDSVQPTYRAELFLFLADRAQHIETVVEPALRAGSTVLCDRFSGSTFAYQIGAHELPDEKFIRAMDAYSRNNVEPDIVFYLDVDPEIGLFRKQTQPKHTLTSFDKKSIEFHTKVRLHFQQQAKAAKHWHQLDANRTMDEVQKDINALLTEIL